MVRITTANAGIIYSRRNLHSSLKSLRFRSLMYTMTVAFGVCQIIPQRPTRSRSHVEFSGTRYAVCVVGLALD